MKRTIQIKSPDLTVNIQMTYESKKQLTLYERARVENVLTDIIVGSVFLHRDDIPYHNIHFKDITVR